MIEDVLEGVIKIRIENLKPYDGFSTKYERTRPVVFRGGKVEGKLNVLNSENKKDMENDFFKRKSTYSADKSAVNDESGFRLVTFPNGRQYFHKTTGSEFAKTDTFGEILWEKVAEQLGVNYNKSMPVISKNVENKTEYSIMSEFLFDREKESLMHFHELQEALYETNKPFVYTRPKDTVQTVLDYIEYVESNPVRIKDKLTNVKMDPNAKLDFFKMMTLDLMLFGVDRHTSNVGFVLNNESNEMKLAPAYDNGRLHFLNTANMVDNNRAPDSKRLDSDGRNFAFGTYFLNEQNYGVLRLDDENPDFLEDSIRLGAEKLLKLAEAIPGAVEFLQGIDKKLDFEKAIKETEALVGFNLPEIERKNLSDHAEDVNVTISETLEDNNLKVKEKQEKKAVSKESPRVR